MKEFRPDHNFGRRMGKRYERKRTMNGWHYKGLKLKKQMIEVKY